MTITTTQKIIRIGSSKGVTIPAKDLKTLGVDAGDEIEITVEVAKTNNERVMAEYEAFKAQYGETLKNLSDR